MQTCRSNIYNRPCTTSSSETSQGQMQFYFYHINLWVLYHDYLHKMNPFLVGDFNFCSPWRSNALFTWPTTKRLKGFMAMKFLFPFVTNWHHNPHNQIHYPCISMLQFHYFVLNSKRLILNWNHDDRWYIKTSFSLITLPHYQSAEIHRTRFKKYPSK